MHFFLWGGGGEGTGEGEGGGYFGDVQMVKAVFEKQRGFVYSSQSY